MINIEKGIIEDHSIAMIIVIARDFDIIISDLLYKDFKWR